MTMNTATKTHQLLSSGDYSKRLVNHYLDGSPKPRLAHYPQIKREPNDSSFSDEMLFDLNALLLRLLHFQNECATRWHATHGDLYTERDAAEAALGRFIGSQLSGRVNEPLIPRYNRDLDDFAVKLKGYVMSVQLYRSVIPFEAPPIILTRTDDARLVLNAIESNRTRLLESFQALRRNHKGWLTRALQLIN
jgi:hypothetical protein